MLVLAEGNKRFDAVDVAAAGCEHGFDIAAIFFVVDGCKALPDGAVFDFLRDAFEDNGLVGLLCADRTIRLRGDVFCFACIRAGAEPERTFPPDSPNYHEMRTAAGTRRGDPIVVGFFHALEGPAPGFQALGWILGHGGVVGPVGTAWGGFVHKGLRRREFPDGILAVSEGCGN